MDDVLFIDTLSIGNFFTGAGASLKQSLARIGVNLHVVNIVDENFPAELTRLLNERGYAFALSYIGVGKGCMSGEQSLWDLVPLPFITIYGDSPCYYFDQHRDFGNWTVSLYVFEEHLQFRRRFSLLRGLDGIAPTLPYNAAPEQPIDLKAKAGGKLIFLKNGNDPRKLREFWRHSLPPAVCEALMELADAMASDLDQCSHRDIVAQVCAYLRQAGLYDGAEKLMLIMVAQLDDYLRRVKSALVGDLLLDYPAEIHGYNWEHLPASNRCGALIAEADYGKSETLIRNALATFDMSPNTSMGVHDRIARAASHQTLCVTNAGQDLGCRFSDAENLNYRFNEESIRTRIEWMLAHRKDVIDLGMRFSRDFSTVHHIENAYAEFKRIAECVRQQNSTAPLENSPSHFMWPPASPTKTVAHRPIFAEDMTQLSDRLGRVEQAVSARGLAEAISGEKRAGLLQRMLFGK